MRLHLVKQACKHCHAGQKHQLRVFLVVFHNKPHEFAAIRKLLIGGQDKKDYPLINL